ncbi:cryptochrome/photolyase family protein [Piscinibacter sakaiensis]|uniref:Deoxyribodipyrimidine photo-lyase n=1 Tax=Piscinibacter sakaiensis TaxID=1547922 RepID=A0A0K8P1E5_PISS1|nr:deoxyribodipyrimidine photo-lyase [Piscinibacter sakaiensis]GAP36359.1 deoxyribodipyrimidine photolyase [Piscinibacter sakaiensis]
MDRPLERALVWLRRDLRIDDNAALYHGLRMAREVWCVFVYDTPLLDPLPRADRRVDFLHASVGALDAALRGLAPGSAGLLQRHGAAVDELPRLAAALQVQAVVASHDDDPAALARDATVRERLAGIGCAMHTVKDHVVFERSEVLTQGGQPYAVFTPYKRAWLARLDDFYLKAYPVARHAGALAARPPGIAHGAPTLQQLGFVPSNLASLKIPTGEAGAQALLDDFLGRIDDYGEARDFPAVKGPSYLSIHLRFGTVSIRRLAREAQARAEASEGAATWRSELVWRDFYHQVLHHHPHVVGQAFRPEYDRIAWEIGPAADEAFAAWCEGRTGYPLVDAAMAQINTTGYMHNRLRMVVASFLVKDLGLDWRRGEAYFATHLNDFDLAANNGGWQWAASSGCDAQPYFRIFNPVTQSERFDPQGRFIRRYLPQLAALPDAALHAPWRARPVDLAAAGLVIGRDYPAPIVDHDAARQRTLARYAVVKDRSVGTPA